MSNFTYAIERIRRRQRFRYWAVGLPLLIIALALPVLRPLRYAREADIATDEYLRLATIRQIADKGTLRLPDDLPESRRWLTVARGSGGLVAAQEPMLSLIGAGVYKALVLGKASFDKPNSVGFYLLTLILSTIPTAVTASLLYRTGRLLELGRSRRIAIAFGSVACTGLLPYAAVISPYPLAAMCVAGAMTVLAQAAMNRPPPAGAGWVVLAGLLAATGAAVHPSVLGLSVALALCTLVMPWRRRVRVVALVIFLLGASLPVTAHRGLTHVMDVGWTVPAPAPAAVPASGPASPSNPTRPPAEEDEELPPAKTSFDAVLGDGLSLVRSLVGTHGLLAYAPATLLGVLGVGRLMTSYWPKTTRGLGVAAVMGLAVPFALWTFGPARFDEHMYGPQYLVAPAPCLLLFAGVLLRGGWAPAKALFANFVFYLILVLSLAVGLIGLLHPYSPTGYHTYAPIQVVKEQIKSR